MTPVAIGEGRFCRYQFGNIRRVFNHENVPSAVFSTPEAATVSMTEADARKKIGR